MTLYLGDIGKQKGEVSSKQGQKTDKTMKFHIRNKINTFQIEDCNYGKVD